MKAEPMPLPVTSEGPYEYHFSHSLVHRVPPGYKLLFTSALSAAAFGAREWLPLAILLLVNFFLYFLAHLKLAALWRDIRFFLVQGLIVLVLYIIRYGGEEGFMAGLRVSLQILLFFMPGAIFLRTTGSLALIKSMRRVFSRRLSFIVFCSFRFIPFFSRELREIIIVQSLRGAPLGMRRLLNPLNWKHILNCLALPLLVRAMQTAEEASLSAEARGMLSQTDGAFSQQYLVVEPDVGDEG